MKGDPSGYFLVQILDNGGKSEFKWVINLSLFFFLMVFCVIVYLCWREEMIWSTRKLRFDFEATNVLCCPLGRYAEKVMAIMQTYGDGQTGGGGGVKKQRFSIGSCKQIRPISYYDLEFFLTKMESLATHAPLPLASSLKLVHSFFYHSSFVLLKKAPQGFCAMFARAPA